MDRDNTIKYYAKLEEVKESINEIRESNINANNFEAGIKEIEKKVKLKVEECYKKFKTENSNTFLSSSLDIIYNDAIKELEKINDYLNSEYTSYFKIQATVNELKTRLKIANYSDVESLVLEAKKLIKSLNEINSIDYEKEKNVVEDVYNTVYEILKLESIYGTSSELLTSIYSDDVDSVYISKLIKKDIKKIKNNKELEKLRKKLKKNGFEGRNYINKDLIRLITYIDNSEYRKDIKASLIEKIEDYEELKEQEDYILEIKDDKDDSVYEIKRYVAQKSIFIGTIVLSILGYSGLWKFADEKNYKYKETIETYDTVTGELETKEVYGTDAAGVNLTVYSPWEEMKSGNYIREKKEYKIEEANLGLENIEDYLKVDAASFEKIGSTKSETAGILLDGMKYNGDRYIITRINIDETDFEKNEDEFSGVIKDTGFILTPIFTAIIAAVYLTTYMETESFSEILEEVARIKDSKKKILELELEKKDSKEELLMLKEKIMMEYKTLPNAIRTDATVKEKIKVLTGED